MIQCHPLLTEKTATKKVLNELNIPPRVWEDERRTILKALEGYAGSTLAKIISLMNKWGKFYSKRMNEYFVSIEKLEGVAVGRISEKYQEKTGNRTKEAKAITEIRQ